MATNWDGRRFYEHRFAAVIMITILVYKVVILNMVTHGPRMLTILVVSLDERRKDGGRVAPRVSD